jgi:3-methyl-2-oxobutanoate hydroxymethyltransferase
MTASKLLSLKGKEKIAMLTAYDFLSAKILEEIGIELILVGDSLGTVFMGYKNTLPVTLSDVLHHVRAVRNGAPHSFIIADMPFLSYGISVEESVKNAGILIQKGGANAVKLEGGTEFADTIAAMIKVGIPVMGHIGLKPQSILKSGLKITGKSKEETHALVEDAKTIEKAGAFSIVIEGTTEEASREITRSVSIPTIGIGAGRYTDGQVLVLTDMLGLDKDLNLQHNKRYANLYKVIKKAVKNYIEDVKSGSFPTEEQIFKRAKE